MFYLLVFSVLFSFQTERKIWVVYQETVCPPAWIGYGDDKQTKDKIYAYLEKQQVKVRAFKITGKAYEITCEGCKCLTGRTINIKIAEKDWDKVSQLGFEKE